MRFNVLRLLLRTTTERLFQWCWRHFQSRQFRHQSKQLRVVLGTIPLFPALPFPFLALPYTIGPAELAYHWHIMGVSGAGKSKLLAQVAAQLILQGRGVSVLDPHTDLAHDIFSLLLRHGYFQRSEAFSQVLYVDFAHPSRFVPFNVLQQPYSNYEIARNLVEACTRAWPSLSGGAAPQFENLLLAAATVLIDNHLPLTALTRLLTDAPFRATLLLQVQDPQVLDFFRSRYDPKAGGGLNESTLRRAFLLTYPPPLRYSLGQQDNILNFRQLMDRQVSVIFNLGGLDAQTQRLLGCLITVGWEEAALSRANLPPAARRPYHLIMDEFSQFSAQSEEAMERVLALTRKYGLYLTLAHQTWSQLSSKLQGALQNTTFLTFRVGLDDADWVASRVGDFWPYQVKYHTRTHPVFVSQAEQHAGWEWEVQHLQRQEALLRVRGRTIKFRTTTVPFPNASDTQALQQVLQRYSETVLVPRPQIAPSSPIEQTRETEADTLQTVQRQQSPDAPGLSSHLAHQRVVPLAPSDLYLSLYTSLVSNLASITKVHC